MLIVQPVLAAMSVKSRWARLARGVAFSAATGGVTYLSAQLAVMQAHPEVVPFSLSPTSAALASSVLTFVGGWLRAGQNNDEPSPSKGA